MTSCPCPVSVAINPPAPDSGSSGCPPKTTTFNGLSARPVPLAKAPGIAKAATVIEVKTSETIGLLNARLPLVRGLADALSSESPQTQSTTAAILSIISLVFILGLVRAVVRLLGFDPACREHGQRQERGDQQ